MKIENQIFIKGGDYSDVKKALKQWISLYSANLQNIAPFKLYNSGKGTQVIMADEKLENEMFYFLVNYLHYPEGINYSVR